MDISYTWNINILSQLISLWCLHEDVFIFPCLPVGISNSSIVQTDFQTSAYNNPGEPLRGLGRKNCY